MEKHRGQIDDADIGAAFAAVRPDVTPPAGAKERLEQRLIDAIRQSESAPQRVARRRGVRRWIVRGAAAAAVAAVVIVALWWLAVGGVATASADFARVIEQVRQATTVGYRLVLQVPGQPDDVAEVLMAGGGNARVIWSGGKTHIYRSGEDKELSFNPATKRAWLHETSAAFLFGEPLEALRRAAESDGELLGTETLDGLEVAVYRVRQAEGDLRVWVNVQDDLPVRVEARSAANNGSVTMILGNFRWNEEIAESAFELTIPPGYVLVRPDDGASEEALIEALRGCAERSAGQFPAQFDRTTINQFLLKGRARVELVDPTSTITVTPEWDDASRQFAQLCAKALAFVDQVNANGSWRYSSDVRLGDSAKPLCWWRLPDKDTYRVIYGDLTVRDVSPGDLPSPGAQVKQ